MDSIGLVHPTDPSPLSRKHAAEDQQDTVQRQDNDTLPSPSGRRPSVTQTALFSPEIATQLTVLTQHVRKLQSGPETFAQSIPYLAKIVSLLENQPVGTTTGQTDRDRKGRDWLIKAYLDLGSARLYIDDTIKAEHDLKICLDLLRKASVAQDKNYAYKDRTLVVTKLLKECYEKLGRQEMMQQMERIEEKVRIGSSVADMS
ncbi:hypothetical protein BZG36_02431 [Bifiguratus adelaidae]|uniref:Uncharacterized protein n=1 Tax=Bifiguratus adelaidae TaxID=1938954 RepID=A0A261Y3K5_9FUNG|nr:hypothetical protein BZG36_02431 [Bifiguratus adelaidae]